MNAITPTKALLDAETLENVLVRIEVILIEGHDRDSQGASREAIALIRQHLRI